MTPPVLLHPETIWRYTVYKCDDDVDDDDDDYYYYSAVL